MNTKILVGIVLYNPDCERLQQNIAAIYNQLNNLLFINNGCENLEMIQELLPSGSAIINNQNNLGVATALNQIMQYALDNDYEWVLTLDQDSVVADNLISVYREVIEDKDDVGMVHCKIHDRNATMQREEALPQVDGYIEQCITSASLVRVEAWRKVGGFDDAMFIDSVDFDFCKALRKGGWKIYRTYKTELLHEVGHSKVIKIFGKEYLSLNHSAFRYYYIVRNTLYLGRKWGGLRRSFCIVARTFWTVLRYEDNKWAKFKRMLKGVGDSLMMPITKFVERKKIDK